MTTVDVTDIAVTDNSVKTTPPVAKRRTDSPGGVAGLMPNGTKLAVDFSASGPTEECSNTKKEGQGTGLTSSSVTTKSESFKGLFGEAADVKVDLASEEHPCKADAVTLEEINGRAAERSFASKNYLKSLTHDELEQPGLDMDEVRSAEIPMEGSEEELRPSPPPTFSVSRQKEPCASEKVGQETATDVGAPPRITVTMEASVPPEERQQQEQSFESDSQKASGKDSHGTGMNIIASRDSTQENMLIYSAVHRGDGIIDDVISKGGGTAALFQPSSEYANVSSGHHSESPAYQLESGAARIRGREAVEFTSQDFQGGDMSYLGGMDEDELEEESEKLKREINRAQRDAETVTDEMKEEAWCTHYSSYCDSSSTAVV